MEILVARVRIVADVDPELRRAVKVAAASTDRSISEWIGQAVRHELERETEQEYYPAEAPKPTGLDDAPRPRSGRTVAGAVIEDRR